MNNFDFWNFNANTNFAVIIKYFHVIPARFVEASARRAKARFADEARRAGIYINNYLYRFRIEPACR